MKKRYVNLILAMASASVLVLGSVPAMAKTDETKTESGEEAEASEERIQMQPKQIPWKMAFIQQSLVQTAACFM